MRTTTELQKVILDREIACADEAIDAFVDHATKYGPISAIAHKGEAAMEADATIALLTADLPADQIAERALLVLTNDAYLNGYAQTRDAERKAARHVRQVCAVLLSVLEDGATK